ncbi:hypothetical protein ABW20_dc0103729 [Dactylellina cionopaga]|nr:hypothetical protein ABW20_dc0103729 [Dactylellina cionopaga]
MSLLQRFVEKIPKCELHVHLEGTLEPETLKRMANRHHMSCPDVFDETGDYYKPFKDLIGFLNIYYRALTVIRAEDDFAELIKAYLEKARSQNVQYAEIFFDPQAHLDRNFSLETILRGVTKGIKQVEDIEAKMIMCFVRDRPLAEANLMLKELLNLPDSLKSVVVGVGLDSYEKDHPPVDFQEIFEQARQHGFKTTMHCDILQDNSLVHIKQALYDVKVDRIDHGTNIIEDEILVKEVVAKKVGFTCCPVSNSFVVNNFEKTKIMHLLEAGAMVTINSDDPAFMNAYMTGNIEKMVDGAAMTMDQVVQTQKNAIDIAWVDENQRRLMMQKLTDYLSLWENTVEARTPTTKTK